MEHTKAVAAATALHAYIETSASGKIPTGEIVTFRNFLA
jgi:hypothetical protein